MHFKIGIALFLFSCLLACNPDKITTQTNMDGVVTEKPFIWKSGISDRTLAYGLYHGYIIDGKGLLSIAIKKSSDPKMYGEVYLQLKDVNTGENIWTWDDFYNKKLERTLNRAVILNEGKLLIHDRYADYCIDSNTGKTIWKSQRGFASAAEPTNVGNQYFISGNPPACRNLKRIEDSMFMGDFDSEKLVEIVRPRYSPEYAYYEGENYFLGAIYRYKTFLLGTDIMILLPSNEMGPPARHTLTGPISGSTISLKRNGSMTGLL